VIFIERLGKVSSGGFFSKVNISRNNTFGLKPFNAHVPFKFLF